MAGKKKKLKNTLGSGFALPTPERLSRGDMMIRNNRGIADEPLRIDKLLRNGIIDEMQHLYGMQIITLWTIARRPFIKTMNYEQRSGKAAPNFEWISLSRMSAEDQFYKTMGFLKQRDHDLITKICLEEMSAIEAGKTLKLPINSITSYVRDAFDMLGEALARMRDVRKKLQKEMQPEE